MAEATMERPVAEKKRLGLSDDNTFFFSNAEEAENFVIKREDGSQAPGFRAYTVKNAKAEIIGYAQARNDMEALGRYAMEKGFTAEVTNPKPRGRGPAVPKIDENVLNMLKTKLWPMGQVGIAAVKEFCDASPQYRACFDWPEGTEWPANPVPVGAEEEEE